MILLILIMLFQTTNITVYAANENTYFARVLFEQVYFYRTPTDSNDTSNIYFELPATYFVELIDKQDDFYKARYLNIIGYVKKDSVQAIAGTPKTPFLNNITFRVYSDLSEKLWSSPSTENSTNLITEIPHLTQNIQFLGKIKGECLISGRTNIWYYCKYTEETDLYGYIYSDFCDEMPTIESNLESFEYIDNPSFEAYVEPTKTIPLTSNYIGIIIGILSVPALIFVFMIIKGTRILTKEKTRSKEVVDY